MIRDLAAVVWIGLGFLALASLPFVLTGRGRTVRDPALAAVNDLGSIQLGERRAAIEARFHFVMRLANGAEVFHHPACPIIRIDVRFAHLPNTARDDDPVTAISDPYLASNPKPQRFAP